MALWHLNRPADRCEATELSVAEALGQLPDTWRVRWGFHYDEESAEAGTREGDFLIQGPTGHVLVLEVKGGQLRNFVLTGRWEGTKEGDNPWAQLLAEWKWAIRRMESVSSQRDIPYVSKALAVPNCNFVSGDRFLARVPRESAIGGVELMDFVGWWEANVASRRMRCDAATARAVFQKAFMPDRDPKAVHFFTRETDLRFRSNLDGSSQLLEMLSGNPQLLVEGGVGTGKTYLALKQAVRYARTGKRVLLLCYNLALEKKLAADVSSLSDCGDGSIEVLGWETLMVRLLERVGIQHAPPDDFDERSEYYGEEIPGLLLEVLRDGGITPAYDALVVDEGQDHDTVFSSTLGETREPGWWAFYLPLLTEGRSSPITVFYDLAQRPGFRSPDGFSPEILQGSFSRSAHVRLSGSVRYTRPIFEFLKGFQSTGADLLAKGLGPARDLPEGPEVIIVREDPITEAVEAIVRDWTGKGLCRLDEILILGHRSELRSSSLGDLEKIGPWPLVDFEMPRRQNRLHYLSINKAKGLDALGVIVIDVELPQDHPDPHDSHELLFMGASRARQMLAVISPKLKP